MSTGALAAIIIVVVIVVAALVTGAAVAARRHRLRRRFGPEYDRVVSERGSQRKAESELASRERRIRSLDIRPLSDTARANYASRWRTIQEQFVDQPEHSVVKAQVLVTTVMKHRGYPIEGHDQMLADLSVEHARTLEHYRLAHTISQSAAEGKASTEDLRQAVIKYRALFSDLLGGAVGLDGDSARRDSGPDGGSVRPDTGMARQDGSTVSTDGGSVRPGGGMARPGGDSAGRAASAHGAPGTRTAAEASAMDADPTEAEQARTGSRPVAVPGDGPGSQPARRRR